MLKTAAAQLSETGQWRDSCPYMDSPSCPLTMECCKAGNAWVKMSIPEVLSSHLTPSRQVWSLPFIPMRGFSCSQCHFRWERLRRQQIHPAAPVTQSSRWIVTASTWEKRANAQREPQEAPHTVRVWSVIPTAKILEKEEGSFLRIISNRIAHKRLLTRTSFQNFMFAPNFEPGPPAKVSWALWQCYRDQAVRRGGGGVWTTHHSYASVCLRLLSWGGGQTVSTLSSTFHLQEWLNVESSFWHRGVFSLAYSHLKSSLHLSVEVEVRGLTKAWKPGLLRAVSGELASSATSPRSVSFDWFGFKSFPKWKSLALSISCEYCLSQDQSVNRNGGVGAGKLSRKRVIVHHWVPQVTALSLPQRMQPNKPLHLEVTLRRYTWCPQPSTFHLWERGRHSLLLRQSGVPMVHIS